MSDMFAPGDRIRISARSYADDPWRTGDEGEVVWAENERGEWSHVKVRMDSGYIETFFRRAIESVEIHPKS